MNEKILESDNEDDYYREEWYIENADDIVDWDYYWEVICDFSEDFFCQFKDEIGMNKLIVWAIQNNNFYTIKTIFDSHFLDYDIDIRLEGDTTPLMWAANHADLDMVKYFIDKGADKNACDENEVSPIYYSAKRKNDDDGVINYLIDLGVDINKKHKLGNTPLMFLAFLGKTDLCDLLICHGADVNAKCYSGASVLWYASKCNNDGKDDTVNLLSGYGAVMHNKVYGYDID